MPNLTIQGHKFEVPDAVIARYAVGYTLQDEGEAHALRQTALENIRNNCAARVKKALKDANGAEELTPEQVAALQTEVEAYAASYKFGERKAGGPRGPRIVDPTEREMNKLAREDITAAFFAKHGEKLKGEQLTDAAAKLLEAKHDDYARRARRALADREKAGLETL